MKDPFNFLAYFHRTKEEYAWLPFQIATDKIAKTIIKVVFYLISYPEMPPAMIQH